MKHRLIILLALTWLMIPLYGQEAGQQIRISTDRTDLILEVSPTGRLYQSYLGSRLDNESDFALLKHYARIGGDDFDSNTHSWEVYAGSGAESFFEPALAITHHDGNPSTILRFVSAKQQEMEGGTETVILLRDDQYPVEVTLHYQAYTQENIIKMWSEIVHKEKKPVKLWRYASSMLYFAAESYHLTEFNSNWAGECQLCQEKLAPGKKVVDSKLGNRNGAVMQPFFSIALDREATEQEGKVIYGTLGWTGNFRFTFEVDNIRNLRIISSINPYASDYQLAGGVPFVTPEFIFTYSEEGMGQASRNFHNWARKYQLFDGEGDRYSLLNNWENTFFDFDEKRLAGLMKEAKELGVDLFLLDDGWFGNKYPRENDKAGLGDWQPTRSKLPGGIPVLVESAKEAGVKFGIWIEPEMVNPKSELFEKHPEWAIQLPNRTPYCCRNQLVLDLCNPQVQDYVFGVVDGIIRENPEVAFFKWDCNSPITNIYSPYLKERQSQLYIDHVRGIYNVLQRVRAKYPEVKMMLCSGGGGRCDYELMKYFTEFWCSDNTNPIERLYIQWGFTQFMPAKSMCAHVTDWSRNTSVKFRTDVASMCKLGFDLGLEGLNTDELHFCQQAIRNWRRLKGTILEGDQYRLVSPYDGNHMALMYVSQDKKEAVLFAYDIHPRYRETVRPVRLQGLDAKLSYRVEEINLMPGQSSDLKLHGQSCSGDFLMKLGVEAFTTNPTSSRVILLSAE